MPARESGQIWRRRADLSTAAELVAEVEHLSWLEDITPDGGQLIVARRGAAGENPDDIWLVPIDAGEPVAVVASDYDEYNARISPDGRLLAFTSDEGGQRQIHLQELATERRWVASPDQAAARCGPWTAQRSTTTRVET